MSGAAVGFDPHAFRLSALSTLDVVQGQCGVESGDRRDGEGSGQGSSSLQLVRDHTRSCEIVSADLGGGLVRWKCNIDSGSLVPTERINLQPLSGEGNAEAMATVALVTGISCLQRLHRHVGVLAISTEAREGHALPPLPTGTALQVPAASALLMVDVCATAVLAVLSGHTDIVRCMAVTPDGGLLTGGGKHDAMVNMWDNAQVAAATEMPCDRVSSSVTHAPVLLEKPSLRLKELGYVFGLVVLHDTKPGSRLYAVAGAWYNRVKIVL